MKAITCIVLIAFSFKFAFGKEMQLEKKPSAQIPDTVSYQEPEILSIINLIATPEKYDGKRVRLIGYLALYFEGTALYLHKEDFNNGITKNAIWVDVSRSAIDSLKDYNLNYVIIDGTFNGHFKGHMDLYSGNLSNIAWLHVWPPDTRIHVKKRKRITH